MGKRKFDFRTIMMILVLFLGNIAIMGTTFYSVIMTQLYATYEAVSYTHLDVYKRQPAGK